MPGEHPVCTPTLPGHQRPLHSPPELLPCQGLLPIPAGAAAKSVMRKVHLPPKINGETWGVT